MDKTDFIAKSKSGLYYNIKEGTGDNLLEEDIKDGYVDYIYYDVYETLADYKEDNTYDGGMILLKKLYKKLSLKKILKIVEEFCDEELEVI